MADTIFKDIKDILGNILNLQKKGFRTAEDRQKEIERQWMENLDKEEKLLFEEEKKIKKEKELVKSEENRTNMFNRMTKATSSMFSGISNVVTGAVNDTFMAVKAIGKTIADSISKIWGKLTGHIRDVLGPIAEAFDMAFDFIKGIGRGILDTFGLSDRETDSEKKRNSLLGQIRDYFFRQEKKEQIEDKIQTKKTPLFFVLAALGTLAGLIAFKVVKPFEILYRAIMLVEKSIAWILRSMGILSKSVKSGETVAKAAEKGLKLFFRPFTLAFKFAFRFLGWFLVIYDFFKGAIAEYGESGDILKSILVGAKHALLKFVEVPVMFIGWLTEKILGYFGIEVKNVSNTIMMIIGGLFDRFVEGWTYIITGIIEIWKKFVDWIGSFTILDEIISSIGNITDPFISFFKDLIGNLLRGITDWLKERISLKSIFNWITGSSKDREQKTVEGIKDLIGNKEENQIKSADESYNNAVKLAARRKNEREREQERVQQEENKKITRAVEKQSEMTGQQTAVIQQINTKNQPSDTKPIPDELDDKAFGFLMQYEY